MEYGIKILETNPEYLDDEKRIRGQIVGLDADLWFDNPDKIAFKISLELSRRLLVKSVTDHIIYNSHKCDCPYCSGGLHVFFSKFLFEGSNDNVTVLLLGGKSFNQKKSQVKLQYFSKETGKTKLIDTLDIKINGKKIPYVYRCDESDPFLG